MINIDYNGLLNSFADQEFNASLYFLLFSQSEKALGDIKDLISSNQPMVNIIYSIECKIKEVFEENEKIRFKMDKQNPVK